MRKLFLLSCLAIPVLLLGPGQLPGMPGESGVKTKSACSIDNCRTGSGDRGKLYEPPQIEIVCETSCERKDRGKLYESQSIVIACDGATCNRR